MKAMILNSYGPDAAFTATDLPTPNVKPGHLLIRVAASSVNTVDTMIRNMGKDLPLSPDSPALLGMDFAGTIEAIGEGVDNFAIGDEVYGCAGGLADLPGALAEYMLADHRLIARKPGNLTMRQAAALPLVGITAWEGLQRAGIHQGQKVLVHGGAGGVGHVALQLAQHFGADLHATGSGEKLSVIENYGATAIDYRNESVLDYVNRLTDGKGFDLVFDSVGGDNMSNSFEAVALNGQVATTGSLVNIDLTMAHFKGLSLHVVFMLIPMLHDHQRQDHGDILAKLAAIAEAGALTPLVDENAYSLEQVGDAYARLASGKTIGKIVITH